MDKQIKDYTREELKEIILDDSNKMKELYPYYRWGQAVFNYVDEYLGVARKAQFEYTVDCFYDDDTADAFIENTLDALGISGLCII